MTDRTSPEGGDEERGVQHPGLAHLAALAREQVAPPVTVTFEHVRAEANTRRNIRWGAQAAVVLAAAVALLWVFGSWGDTAAPADTPALVRAAPVVDLRTAPHEQAAPEEPLGQDSSVVVRQLAGGGTVHGDAVAAMAPTQDGSVRLGDGEFRVETGSVAVDVLVYDRVLEVAAHSVVTMAVSVQSQRVEVQAGAASWRNERTEVELEDGDRDGEPKVTAERLVRRAEAQMKAANRSGAIRTLTTLTRRFPRSGAAKAAILDLARLRKAGGQPHHARCAYTLFLKRWPKAADADAVRRARDRLPGTRECRGLVPQSP